MSVAAHSTLYRSNIGANSSTGPGQPLQLPKIVHSASRVATDPNTINVRGVSRASSLGDIADKMHDNSNNGRPLPYEFNEESLIFQKKKLAKSSATLNSGQKSSQKIDLNYSIPDGVKTVYSPDVGRTSMPVFGTRPDTNLSNGKGGRLLATPTQQRAEIDEIFYLLKDRVKVSYHEVKTKFKNADHDGKGVVSKDALAHIIAAILGPSKPMSHQQFNKLVERLDFKNKNLIKFDDFIACFQEAKNETSEWVDPVRNNNSQQAPITRKATQVYVILKEKCKQKSKDITSLVPQLVGGNSNRIFKPELLNTIGLMSIKMDNEEYDKLWKKFDTENLGVVHSEVFLKKLGLTEYANDSPRNDSPKFSTQKKDGIISESIDELPLPYINDTNGRKSFTRSINKNPIEKWLKKRFREGFAHMKNAFEEIDMNKTNHVKKEQFLNVLRKFGLKLELHLLDAFLDRCNIDVKGSALVPYTKFLEKFQNRSEQGLTYKVITGNVDNNRAESAIGQIERKLLRMFQRDFLSLLTIFRKIDRNKTNTISKQEFRAALESHFNVEMSDSEFQEFCKDLPSEDQNIKYLEFMTRFDTDDTSSLFDAASVRGDSPPPSIKKRDREWETIQEEVEEFQSPRVEDNPKALKNLKALREAIKDYIRNHYKEVESKWSDIDKSNTGEMTKDTFWELLKNLKIHCHRNDIDLLWKEFILKDNNNLEYWQFVRSFGYSKKSGAFQNAKRAPPKRGDCDMVLTSNKLGRDSILIRGSVHGKLRLQCELLRRSFLEMDPYHSGYVLRDEYKEILLELCPELNEEELEILCEKYENPFDERINYNLFLQPYTIKIRSKNTTPVSRLDTNDPLIQKLRYKLSDNYKELRRSFKQKDYKQTGKISISAFKECIASTKVNLNDEEMYSLLNRLDTDMSGSINYSKFLNEMVKP